MSGIAQRQTPASSKYLSVFGAWALSFGCAVGWGAFVMPGTTFLPLAGPVGTALGMGIGAVLMLIIGVNYHYLMNREPNAGSSMAFASKAFGYDHGFLSAWFLILVYVAIMWANATALALIARNLTGSMFQFGFHYQILGYDVYLGEALLSAAAIALVGYIGVKGRRFAVRIQIALAVVLICGIVVCFVAVMTSGAATLPAAPAFSPTGGNPSQQVFQIVALAPWAFVGFESISNSTRTFKFPVRRTIAIFAVALVTSVVAYALLAYVAASVQPAGYPNWQAYIAALGSLEGLAGLPTFFAAQTAMGEVGLALIGVTVLCAIFTGLIASYLAASRILFSMAEDDILPGWFGKVNSEGAPKNAILFLLVVSLFIPFLGRTAIGWIVDVNTIGATIAYTYASASAFRIARRESNALVQVSGIVGVGVSVLFFLYFMIPNLWPITAMATESYLILIAWSILGFLVYRTVFRGVDERFGKSPIVWIVLLSLILTSSLIWMRQSTRDYTEQTLENLNNYNVAELAEHGIEMTETQKADSEYYLENQMNEVGDFLTRNSAAQMTMIVIALLIMFNIYNTITRQQRELEKQKLTAEESSKAKTTFLFNMSHDIRTPMNAILGYTALAKKEPDVPVQVEEYLEKIDSSSQHLLSLINDVLEMSRIESGKLELDLADMDIVESVQEMRSMFQTQMDSKGIDFKVDVEKVSDRWVLCDKGRLDRVLLNLLSNAYKFTPEGGSIWMSLAQLAADEGVGTFELRVKDTGIGMSEEFAAKVFESFERERTSTVSGIQGTGLGMAITKSIVSLMDGDIEVFTKAGEGTEFVIRVQLALVEPPASAEAGTAESADESGEFDFAGRKILLVEDNEINREIATLILEDVGFDLDAAENGKIAFETIRDSPAGTYDVVLMDIQMPVMDGYEASRAIRALDDEAKASVPIIAVTANAFTEDVKNAEEAGMNGHVAKPLDVAQLISVLSETLK